MQKSQAKVIVGFDELKDEEDEYADGDGSEDALSLAVRGSALHTLMLFIFSASHFGNNETKTQIENMTNNCFKRSLDTL